MLFYPEKADVPERLTTDEVVVRPLRSTDAEADYDALMSSREMLRVWDQSDWPSDEFTLEENRADLAEHESDHASRRAFTYTVTDPAEERCLGCVYIYPLEPILKSVGESEGELADVGDFEAYVTFWVRESELAGGLERRLLAGLIDWFDREWAFGRVAFGTNSADARQISVLGEMGFETKWRYPVPGRATDYVICAREQGAG